MRTKLGLWVEMMAYMGQLGMVTGMLDVALAYIKVCSRIEWMGGLTDVWDRSGPSYRMRYCTGMWTYC